MSWHLFSGNDRVMRDFELWDGIISFHKKHALVKCVLKGVIKEALKYFPFVFREFKHLLLFITCCCWETLQKGKCRLSKRAA